MFWTFVLNSIHGFNNTRPQTISSWPPKHLHMTSTHIVRHWLGWERQGVCRAAGLASWDRLFGDEEAESYKNLRFVNSDFSEEPATAGKIPFSYGCFCFMRCGGYSLSKEGQSSKIMFTLESQRSWQEETSWRKTKRIKNDDDDHDANASVHPDADAHARSEFRCSEFSSVFISVAIVWCCLMFSLANLMFDQFPYHAISISRYSRRYSIRTAASAACAWRRSARRRRWRAGPMGDPWGSALTLLMGREGCGACGLEMLILYFC